MRHTIMKFHPNLQIESVPCLYNLKNIIIILTYKFVAIQVVPSEMENEYIMAFFYFSMLFWNA